MLDSLLEHTFQDFAAPNTKVSPGEMVRNFDFWLQHRKLLDALANSDLMDKLYFYTMRYTDPESVEKLLHQSELKVIAKDIHLFIASGLVSLVIAWHAEGFCRSPQEMASVAHKILTMPLFISQ